MTKKTVIYVITIACITGFILAVSAMIPILSNFPEIKPAEPMVGFKLLLGFGLIALSAAGAVLQAPQTRTRIDLLKKIAVWIFLLCGLVMTIGSFTFLPKL